MNTATHPGPRLHPAWSAPTASPAAQALGHLVVEAAGLMRQLADPARPPAEAQRRQAARLLRLAEACLAALDPTLVPVAPEGGDETRRLRDHVADVLTPREREVLTLLASGQTDRQIAARLGVAHRTATTHVGRILGKLQVQSRAAAASLAVRAGYA